MSDPIIGKAGTVFEGFRFEVCEEEKDGCQDCDRFGQGLCHACYDINKGVPGNWKRIKASEQECGTVCEWVVEMNQGRVWHYTPKCNSVIGEQFEHIPGFTLWQFCPYCGKPIKEVVG